MKFTTRFFALALGASLFGLGACSDDNNNNPVSGGNTNITLIATTQNSYYIYNGYQLDSAGGKVSGSDWTDSTVITGTQTVEGKSATRFQTFSSNGSRDTSYYYTNGNGELFSYAKLSGGASELEAILKGRRWVKVGDTKKNSSWTIFDTTITNTTITFMGFPISVSGKLTISGNHGSDTTMMLNGASKTVAKFTTNVKFVPEGTGPSISTNTYNYYADNIGLVMTKADPSFVNFLNMNIFVREGYVQTLSRFKVEAQ